jgi:hypothetical protein
MQAEFNVRTLKQFLLFVLTTLLFMDLLEKVYPKNRVIINLKKTNADHGVECLGGTNELPVPDFCDEYAVTTEATGDLAELSSLKGRLYGCMPPCMSVSEKINALANSFTYTHLPGYPIEALAYQMYSARELAIRIDYKITDKRADNSPESKKIKLKPN